MWKWDFGLETLSEKTIFDYVALFISVVKTAVVLL